MFLDERFQYHMLIIVELSFKFIAGPSKHSDRFCKLGDSKVHMEKERSKNVQGNAKRMLVGPADSVCQNSYFSNLTTVKETIIYSQVLFLWNLFFSHVYPVLR